MSFCMVLFDTLAVLSNFPCHCPVAFFHKVINGIFPISVSETLVQNTISQQYLSVDWHMTCFTLDAYKDRHSMVIYQTFRRVCYFLTSYFITFSRFLFFQGKGRGRKKMIYNSISIYIIKFIYIIIYINSYSLSLHFRKQQKVRSKK